MNDVNDYIASVEAWRKQREETLRAPDGWLSLTGLFELRAGEQTIGSSEACDIVLPGSAPEHLGTLAFKDNVTTLSINTDAAVLVDGVAVRQATLDDDGDGAKIPTKVTVGSVTFFVHSYGDRYAIRIKDSASPAMQAFAGCTWFPVNPSYRVPGKFVPHAQPQVIQIETVMKTVMNYDNFGSLDFSLHGQPISLVVTGRYSKNQLAIILRDATAGKQTYAAVRFLTVHVDDENNADVDLNKIYNPPCAFTPYATCPLPPRQNILAIAVEAGETLFGAH